MTVDQFERAVEFGREFGGAADVDAVCLGEMGIGNTSASTLVCHKLLELPLEALTGRGTGLDDAGLRRKYEVLEAAAARTPGALDVTRAMTEYGGFEIAMMAGAMLGAAAAQTLVIVDGFVATAAASAAISLDSSVKDAMVFAHKSAERGHAAVLHALGVEPLLDLQLRLGEGTGALLAWPLVRSAAAMLRDMASFDSAGVSGPA
jgi:nicotinate-nucleotide--dimethylbenzimidazole phosphoribosyltransferase